MGYFLFFQIWGCFYLIKWCDVVGVGNNKHETPSQEKAKPHAKKKRRSKGRKKEKESKEQRAKKEQNKVSLSWTDSFQSHLSLQFQAPILSLFLSILSLSISILTKLIAS